MKRLSKHIPAKKNMLYTCLRVPEFLHVAVFLQSHAVF